MIGWFALNQIGLNRVRHDCEVPVTFVLVQAVAHRAMTLT